MVVLYTEDTRRKQLAAQAARNKNKEESGGGKRLSARSPSTSTRSPAKDTVVGPTSNELNPLFSSMAVAGSPEALRSRDAAIAAVLGTDGAPTESVWRYVLWGP